MNPSSNQGSRDELRSETLEFIVRQAVVKAQHGTIGELTDVLVKAINAHTQKAVTEALTNVREAKCYTDEQLNALLTEARGCQSCGKLTCENCERLWQT